MVSKCCSAIESAERIQNVIEDSGEASRAASAGTVGFLYLGTVPHWLRRRRRGLQYDRPECRNGAAPRARDIHHTDVHRHHVGGVFPPIVANTLAAT